jgi:trehalose 6-phosphate phosphatase
VPPPFFHDNRASEPQFRSKAVVPDEFRDEQLTPNDPRKRRRSGSKVRRGTPKAAETHPPERLQLDQCALFLDVDGTLIDIAARPADVVGDAQLLQLLCALRLRCQGALALISGRRIADLDRITAPERFAAAGVHGFERRNARGDCVRLASPTAQKVGEIRRVLTRLVSSHPQLLLEDKDNAVAVHYRQAPHLREIVENAIHGLPGLHDGGLRVQHGRMVAEIIPSDASKAIALAAFMAEVPFKGRVPVYLGDDITDESAFQWANAAGGLSIAVGRRQSSCARANLDSVDAVRAWLHALTHARDDGRD